MRVLEQGHPFHSEPTRLALLSDGSILYVANSQWASYGDGGLREGRTPTDTYILRLALPLVAGGVSSTVAEGSRAARGQAAQPEQ